jgi:rubrerythrin
MSAGKGDTPRPVDGDAYRDNYEAAFRKVKWPHDPEPFESPDHDNDSTTYNQIFGPKLPSRRYNCEGCGENWRRNNSPESRTTPPICPSCHNDLMQFKRIEKMIPKIIHLKAKYPEL